MKQYKNTKIVATLGPACKDKDLLKDMIIAGVNVFRINFSHAVEEDVRQRVKYIREINEELDTHVALLADLQGPKLRVGEMDKRVKLKEGDTFTFTTEKCLGTSEKAYMTYQQFPQDVKKGEHILVDDGKLLFEVVETDQTTQVKTKVLRGGKLKSKKGVNLPNTNVSLPALTEKDKKDVELAIALELDWVALSFVRFGNDVKQLREFIDVRSDYKIPIIAKIEKPEAVQNISQILPECDGIMVARGDLGVEIPMHKVPLIQKRLVRKAKEAHKPVIIATQMMETMIENEVPTRAEVNDVANSILDGADAMMLSGETSVGKYPLGVIQQMSSIIRNVEDTPMAGNFYNDFEVIDDRFISKTVCRHAVLAAESVEAKVISTLTNSGYTAFKISAGRPHSAILAFTQNKRILTMLNLLWGVKAFYYNKDSTTDETVVDINKIAESKGYLKKGDYVVNLTSMPLQEKGMVNTMRITKI